VIKLLVDIIIIIIFTLGNKEPDYRLKT